MIIPSDSDVTKPFPSWHFGGAAPIVATGIVSLISMTLAYCDVGKFMVGFNVCSVQP